MLVNFYHLAPQQERSCGEVPFPDGSHETPKLARQGRRLR